MQKKGKHYVIGDVHGCYEDFLLLKEKIEKRDPEATIILTGDFLDRGPEVWEMLGWAMEHIRPGGKYQSVLGNHEEMVLEWYREWKCWYQSDHQKKEPTTYYDFDMVMRSHDALTPEKLEPVMEFLGKLPFRIEVEMDNGVKFDVVHASDTFEPTVNEEERKERNLWWRSHDVNRQKDTIIVHGHTPTVSGLYQHMDSDRRRRGMIGYLRNDINVDGGCFIGKNDSQKLPYPCMLCAICLETLEEIYPRTLEEQFAHQNGISEKEAESMAEEYRSQWETVENPHLQNMKELLKNGFQQQKVYEELFGENNGGYR